MEHHTDREVAARLLALISEANALARRLQQTIASAESGPSVHGVLERRSGAAAESTADRPYAQPSLRGHAPAVSLDRLAYVGMVRRYSRGSTVHVDAGSVGRIANGVVALWATHADGAEALIGLLGGGDYLLHHPRDDCNLAALAHTDAEVVIEPRHRPLESGALGSNMESRLLRAEAWAAMQAHPHIERRLVGLLRLLAEQFGTEYGDAGLLIDLRLTHDQLAAAVGSTRVTVTRTLQALALSGELKIIGRGANQRLYLTNAS